MRLKRTLAFVLTLAMLLGNVTPAFAAENSVSGNVVLTTDEDGNLQIKELSDEGSDGQMPDGNGSSDLNGGSGGDDTASDNDSGVSGNEPSVSDNDEPLIEVYHEGMSERLLFSSFGEAKEYIINDATENTNTRKEYELYLLGDVTIEDEEKDVLYYADEITGARIYLGLCGYTLEVKTDQNIRVNDLDAGRYEKVGEEWELSKQGIIDVADGKTLSFYPRKTRGWIANVNLKAEKATVVVGNSEIEEGEFIDLHNVTANVNNMELYDGIHWEGAGEANVGNLLKVKNDRNTYEAHIRSKLVTKHLEIVKGSNVHVADFEVTEDTTVTEGSSFRIESGGNAVFQNIHVTEKENEDFRFDFEQTVKLNSVDENGKAYADYKNAEWDALFSSGQFSPEEVFNGVEVLDSKGMFTVKGVVTGPPIHLQKIFCWNLPAEENRQQAAGVDFDIENGEDLAIINEQISEENFYIDIPGGYVHKYTDEQGIVRLKAIKAALTVWVEEMQWAEDYPSLEAAAASIEEDFGGHVGTYRFFFKENMSLKKDVTLPDCVKEAYFETEGFGIGEGEDWQYIGRYQKILDLNGKKLTLPARLNLQAGLRITSNAIDNGKKVPGKINIASDDYVALYVTEYDTLVDDRGWNVEQRLPVLSDVEVNLENRRAEFRSHSWTEENEILWHDLENTVLQAEELYLEGAFKFDKVTAKRVENNDIFFVNTLDMCGGNLINRHRMVADKIVNLGDFNNEYQASFICNELEQQEGKNTYLGYESRIMFNKAAVLYNVHAEQVTMGKGSQAQLQMNGYFSVGEEDQKLWIAITDSYADIDGLRDDMTYYDPYCYRDSNDVVLKIPEANEKLFTTDKAEFPAGNIAVLPYEIYDVSGNHVGDNIITGAILHADGDNYVVRAAGETVSVFAVNADGESESWLKGFTGWDEAVKYLEEVGNRNGKYVLHVRQPEIDFGGKLELPKNVAQIKIRGGMDVPVVLQNTGNIELATDLVLESVNFDKEITINANKKVLGLYDMRSPVLNEEGKEVSAECVKIKAIENADTVFLRYSLIELTDEKEDTTVDELDMICSVWRTAGNFSADTLLVLRAEKGNSSHVEASGTVELQDVVTYGMANRLNYAELVINGTLKAYAEDGRRDDSSVYAIPQSRTVTIGEETEATVDYYVISEERPQEGEYLEFKKNALTLFFYDGRPVNAETQLAKAPNIAPTWFVYNRWGERMDDTQVEVIQNVTRKEGSDIKYGAKGDQDLNVILKACIEYIYEEETQTWGPVWGEVGKYVTLQEALTEIQNIDDCEMLYNITLGSDVKSAEFIFPSNAECIWIEGIGEMKNIHFKGELSVHSNVDFKNVNLVPDSENGTLNINEYIVSIVDSKMKDNMTVVGNGNNCELHVASSEVTLKTLENVDILSAYLDAKVTVGDDFTTKVLCMIRNATICGLGTIQTEKIECYGENTLVTVPANVKWVDGKITAMTSNLDISGSLNTYETVYYEKEGEKIVPGALNIELGTLGEKGQITYIKAADFSQQLISSNKAVLAKAPNMGTEGLKFHGESGKIYKKSGNLVYKDAKAAVELVYDNGEYDENGIALEVTKVSCETFADAVAEINSLKTKRDYKIKFLTSEISAPTEFKMPNKNYVNTLMITAATENGGSDIYYVKDINLTSNTEFTMANLIQVSAVKENGTTVYKPVAGDKAVKIKTGGNNLTFEGGLYFNTPIAFEGGNKGTLSIGDAHIHTVCNYKEVPEYAKDSDSYIQGTISKFASVSVEQRLYLDGWKARDKYTPASIQATGLHITSVGKNYNDITVGNEKGTGDKVKVNDLILTGANLYVYGDGEFKNVTFAKGVEENTEESAAELWVYGQKFNITGVLTSAVAFAPVTVGTKEVLGGAKLVTNVNSKLEPVLNVSGTVALGDIQKDRIIVRVMDTANDALTGNKAIPLGKKAGEKTYNNYLLKAKKANEAYFLADWDCTGGKEVFDVNTLKGDYFLKKNQDFVEVVDAAENGVILRKDFNSANYYVNYYENLDAALSAIKSFNDKKASYLINLLGSTGKDYQLVLPDKAALVVFTGAAKGNEPVTLYNASKKNVQKADIAFDNIKVENTGTWDSKKFDLTIVNAGVNVAGKTNIGNLTLDKGAVLETEDVTVITDIDNQYTITENSEVQNGANEQNRIICKPGTLTIKGYVTDTNLGETEGTLNMVLETVGAKPISTAGNKVQYVLSDTAKFVVLEKENMEKFNFFNETKDVTENVAWASKGIYYLPNGYTNKVKAEKFTLVESEEGNVEKQYENGTVCLDMAEASNYINMISDKNSEYMLYMNIDRDEKITDTNVTDANEVSRMMLPGKDKAEKIVILSGSGTTQTKVYFTEDLKVNGSVEFDGIGLINDEFDIICEKNSDRKNGKQVILGNSGLKMWNVSASGLQNIAGTKGATIVELNDVDLTLQGGITNVAELYLNGWDGSNLVTKGASQVQDVGMSGTSSWDAMGVTVIGDIELYDFAGTGTDGKEPAAYVGTYHKDNKPQLTITGKVNGTNLPIKLFDFATGKEIKKADYEDAKLVCAKTESAEKFIAFPYARYYEETAENGEVNRGYTADFPQGVAAYKEEGVYVCNGDITSKEVILAKQNGFDENGEIWTNSYVDTYKEAIDMINSQGKKDDVYKITFVKGNDAKDDNHIITDSILLPKANKIQRLTIDGDNRRWTYTGAISATCNLEFVNVALEEVKNNEPVRGIALNTNKYNVGFGENVSTVHNAGINSDEYNLEFASIKANKGGVGFSEHKVYSYGEVNVGKLTVVQNAELYAEQKVNINDIRFMNGVGFALAGEKAITLNNVNLAVGDIKGALLDITTWYTSAASLDKSKSQLTVKGEVDPQIEVNVNPVIPTVGTDEKGNSFVEPRVLTREHLEDFIMNSGEKPQTYQKVINAPKMMASDNVTLIYADCHAVRYDGGIYFSWENKMVEVVGYEEADPEENGGIPYREVYRAGYLDWDMAVKEIDKLKRTDWIYDIILYRDLGINGTPVPSLSLPSKAKAIAVCGEDGNSDIGILTTAKKITLKCPTEFVNISIHAVEKKDEKITQIPVTVDSGKFYMNLLDIPYGCDIEATGWYENNWKLTGKNTIEFILRHQNSMNAVKQISNAGTVIFNPTTRQDGDSGVGLEHAYYEIADGIQKVNLLQILPGAEVNSFEGKVSVKDLYVGEATGETETDEENGNVYQSMNELHSGLRATNISSSGTTTLASSNLKAGTKEVGDGKITLNNVVFKDTHNHIEGKQDAEGNSLISIQGSTTTEDINPGWTAATIALTLSNSANRYAQLREDMHIMTAPKAISSMFRLHYGWDGELNMGPEIMEFVPELNENGEPIRDEEGNVQGYHIPTFGLYKDKDDIKYGKVREVCDNNEVIERNEAMLWLGTNNPDSVSGNVPTMECATFEEAIAAINNMPEYKEYTMELLKDIEIGNENGDGKYSALALPAKASEVTIRGWGRTISFSGNIALKSNTTLEGITLVPMKTVKDVSEPTMTNITVGNYKLTVRDARVGYWDGEPYNSEFISCLDKISGSAKGRLVIGEYTEMTANIISGVAVEFAGNGEGYAMGDNGTPEDENDDVPVPSCLAVNKSLTTKELKFTDYTQVYLVNYGKLTTDAIYVVGETVPCIGMKAGSSMQIKGTTRTLEDGSKETDSVFFDEVFRYTEGENGEQIVTSVETTDTIVLDCESATDQDIPAGTKVITGKYLNPADWTGYSYWFGGGNYRFMYLSGTDLYLGGVVPGNG